MGIGTASPGHSLGEKSDFFGLGQMVCRKQS